MGMMCTVLGVTPAQIVALRAKPVLVSKLTLVARIDLLTSLGRALLSGCCSGSVRSD
jgi:hypothetical protein